MHQVEQLFLTNDDSNLLKNFDKNYCDFSSCEKMSNIKSTIDVGKNNDIAEDLTDWYLEDDSATKAQLDKLLRILKKFHP